MKKSFFLFLFIVISTIVDVDVDDVDDVVDVVDVGVVVGLERRRDAGFRFSLALFANICAIYMPIPESIGGNVEYGI